jgi:hypothetical protein
VRPQPYSREQVTIHVNGMPVEVIRQVFVEPDECASYEDLGPTEFERKQVNERLERGDLSICVITVEYVGLSCQGGDSLGGVWVESDKDILRTIEEHGMIAEAEQAFLQEIKRMARLLAPFAGGAQ